MNFATILKTTAASTLLVAASAAQGTALSWDAGAADNDWNSANNWNPNQVPTLADDVTIPTGYTGIQIVSANASANSVTIQGTSKVEVLGYVFEIDGGAASSLNAADAIKLNHVDSTLLLSGTQTFSGAGSIMLDDLGALMELSSGVTITFSVPVHGFGSISAVSGTATMVNDNDVTADSSNGALELASDLILSDSAGKLWRARGGGELQFKRQHTGGSALKGDVTLGRSGTLNFFESVAFEDASGTPLFTRSGITGQASTLVVAASKTFSYESFTTGDSCSNPGSGTPYAVSAGTYPCP